VVVAAVQGHAIGAGFQLALAADLRVVADDVQLVMRETSLGLVPDLGGTGPLVGLVGYSKALELCATGRAVGAAEAVASGLAAVAVPAEELDATTGDLVAAILSAPEPALRELKPLLRAALTSDRDDQLRLEREAQSRLLHALAAARPRP
jgi:enoyl-CoA hydratase/carnithine racemase